MSHELIDLKEQISSLTEDLSGLHSQVSAQHREVETGHKKLTGLEAKLEGKKQAIFLGCERLRQYQAGNNVAFIFTRISDSVLSLCDIH
jgi:hypothetical protein